MAGSLLVLASDGEHTAKTVWDNLGELEEAGVIEVEDAVIAWRPAPEGPGLSSSMASTGVSTAGSVSLHGTEQSVYDPGKVQIEQTHHPLEKKYAGKGAAIGFVAGLLLGGPIGGPAVGAGIGAITGSMKAAGIKDDFIKQTSQTLRPGASALFILGHANDPDQLLEALRAFEPRVLATTLDPETEQRLRDQLKS